MGVWPCGSLSRAGFVAPRLRKLAIPGQSCAAGYAKSYRCDHRLLGGGLGFPRVPLV